LISLQDARFEAREITVEIREQFMASDRDFRQWQK
jgi:hypothetical protein